MTDLYRERSQMVIPFAQVEMDELEERLMTSENNALRKRVMSRLRWLESRVSDLEEKTNAGTKVWRIERCSPVREYAGKKGWTTSLVGSIWTAKRFVTERLQEMVHSAIRFSPSKDQRPNDWSLKWWREAYQGVEDSAIVEYRLVEVSRTPLTGVLDPKTLERLRSATSAAASWSD